MDAGELITAKEAVRRVLILENCWTNKRVPIFLAYDILTLSYLANFYNLNIYLMRLMKLRKKLKDLNE